MSELISAGRRINLALKRLIDVLGSGIGLVILSPLFLVIAVLIKKNDKGPVFFIQQRLGYKGREFGIIKFRTMASSSDVSPV